MRKGLSLVAVVTVVLLLGLIVLFSVTSGTGTKMTEEQKTAQQSTREQQKQTWEQQQKRIQATGVIEDIIYIKDTRTDLCFAYLWRGDARGGPALATVPCDSIPPELLVVVTPDSPEPEEAK